MATPKLRFKEFDGDWILNNIGKFLIEYKEKVPSSTEIEIYSSSREGLKPQKDYFDNRELQNFGEYGVVPPNYFTYRHMSDDTTFKFNINSIGKKIAVSKEYPVFTTNENLDSQFLLLKLNESNDFKKFAIEQKKGGTRTRLYFKALCTWETRLPSISEQTKIASFLSAVDEKISQLTQKHELLSQYKQGMMQKLFSQQIRFKADDGSEFGEWEKLTLSQISKHIGGTALESYVSECGDYNFISIGNYSTNGKYIDNSQRIILNEKTGTKLLDKDDLVMVLNDKTATGDLIGSTILINEDNKYIYNQRSERIICNKSKVLSVYLWHFLNSEMMRSEVRKLAQGGTQIYINFSSVLSIIFLLPCLAEQNKIANFLSAIDQKIEVVAQQIEQAKTWKKGLLQQMFV